MASIRAVLFDAVGTLIEVVEPVGESYARLARQAGVSLPAWRLDDAFRRVFAASPPMVFATATAETIAGLERGWWREVVRSTFLATDGTVRFADFDTFFESTWQHFSAPAAWRTRPGAQSVLAELRQAGLRLAIVSNFDHRLPNLLQYHGIMTFLDTVTLPSDAAAQKPAPEIFHLALERLGVGADQSVYVGDDPVNDIEGAQRAGLAALDVATSGGLAAIPARVAALATLGPGRATKTPPGRP